LIVDGVAIYGLEALEGVVVLGSKDDINNFNE